MIKSRDMDANATLDSFRPKLQALSCKVGLDIHRDHNLCNVIYAIYVNDTGKKACSGYLLAIVIVPFSLHSYIKIKNNQTDQVYQIILKVTSNE